MQTVSLKREMWTALVIMLGIAFVVSIGIDIVAIAHVVKHSNPDASSTHITKEVGELLPTFILVRVLLFGALCLLINSRLGNLIITPILILTGRFMNQSGEKLSEINPPENLRIAEIRTLYDEYNGLVRRTGEPVASDLQQRD
nr:hypothetical protein [Oscillatoria laete-virens]